MCSLTWEVWFSDDAMNGIHVELMLTPGSVLMPFRVFLIGFAYLIFLLCQLFSYARMKDFVQLIECPVLLACTEMPLCGSLCLTELACLCSNIQALRMWQVSPM